MAKKNHFNNSCDNHKNDSKTLWKSLKELGLPSKKENSSSKINIGLKISDEICFDKQKVAEEFNNL
jgi:hypothetical protein